MENAHRIISENFGKVDILINGAGGNSPGNDRRRVFDYENSVFPITKVSLTSQPKDLNMFGLNMTGAVLASQVFAKACSINRARDFERQFDECFHAAHEDPGVQRGKAASNFTRWLAVHFAKTGIRVNAIAPGFFSTAQNAALL